MKRRRFTCIPAAAAAALLLAAGVPAWGSDDTKVLVLLSSDAVQYKEVLQGIREAMEKDTTVRLEVRSLEGNSATAGSVPAEAVPRQGGVVLALGPVAVEAVGRQALPVPLVVGMVPRERDIEEAGKGATGVSLQYSLDTQFEHLRLLLPQSRRVGLIYGTDEIEEEVPQVMDAAARQGFELRALKVDGPPGIPGALESLSRRVDVIWTMHDRLLLDVSTAKGLILFSFRNRLPLVGLSPSWVRAGALYSMSWDFRDIGRQCGEMALKAMDPQSSAPPPASPRRVHYRVNKKTADQMKLVIDESVLSRAQKVY